MSSLEVRGALLDGRVDASFGNDTPNDPRLRSQRLFAERLMVVLPRPHRLGARRAVTLRDIDQESIVWMARSDVPEVSQNMADQLRARGLGGVVLWPLADITIAFDSVLSRRAADHGSDVLRSLREIAESVAPTHRATRR